MMKTGGEKLNDLYNQWDIEYQNTINSQDSESKKPYLKQLLSNSLKLKILTELHTKNTLGIGIYSNEVLMCIEGMIQFNKSKSAVLAKILSLWSGVRIDNPMMQSDWRVANPSVCLMGGI